MFYDTLECRVELLGSGSPSQIYLPEKKNNNNYTQHFSYKCRMYVL